MWILLIVTLFGATVLEKYTTYEECDSEKVRISKALQEAYPGETDFKLECRLKGEKISWLTD